jgi:hypothetical protein
MCTLTNDHGKNIVLSGATVVEVSSHLNLGQCVKVLGVRGGDSVWLYSEQEATVSTVGLPKCRSEEFCCMFVHFTSEVFPYAHVALASIKLLEVFST